MHDGHVHSGFLEFGLQRRGGLTSLGCASEDARQASTARCSDPRVTLELRRVRVELLECGDDVVLETVYEGFHLVAHRSRHGCEH